MNSKVFSLLLTLVIFSFLSCEKVESNCDKQVEINNEKYNSAKQDVLIINELEIIDDCLHINFSASGCSGDSWKLELIDSGHVLYSNPPGRDLILSFENPEKCEAYITKDLTFDISVLKLKDSKVKLFIKNNRSLKSILYKN